MTIEEQKSLIRLIMLGIKQTRKLLKKDEHQIVLINTTAMIELANLNNSLILAKQNKDSLSLTICGVRIDVREFAFRDNSTARWRIVAERNLCEGAFDAKNEGVEK